MKFAQIDEDKYWENVREGLESQDPGPYEADGNLFLDDLHEEIESSYGYPVEELYEGDLMEIVEKYQDIFPKTARYDRQFDCISYTYFEKGA